MNKISVIVPIYKVEKFLNKCVDSIINQTYKNLEIILVDDGSPDNCGKICDEYARKDERVKVIHKENGGLSDARNAGLDIAEGEYIVFVDSDDYISEQMIELLYKKLIADNSDMAICKFYCVDDDGNIVKTMNVSSPIKTEKCSSGEMLDKLSLSDCWNYIVAWNKIYKKELFDDIRFPKGKFCEDNYVVHYIFEKCKNISCIETPLYYYVQRQNSLMSSNFSIKNFDEAEGYFERALFVQKYDMTTLMYNSAIFGGARLCRCYQNLNMKDKNIRTRYKEVKKLYNKVYGNLLASNLPIRKKVLLSLYYIDVRLYDNIDKTLKLMKKCCVKIGMRLDSLKNAVFLGKLYLNKLFHKNKFFCLLMTPEHENIGDAAITVAEKRFLKNYFPEHSIFEISELFLSKHGKKFKKIFYQIIKNEKILIQSGGFLGTIWFNEGEAPFRDILKNSQSSNITVLPQTMYYEDNDWGRTEFEKSKKIYNRNDNLKICLREKYSHHAAKDAYLNTFLIPDMVMYINQSDNIETREGIKLCLRSDIEKTILPEEEKKIFDFAKAHYGENISCIDMLFDRKILPKERENVVTEHLKKFKTAELVITDRLHGMIFAAITGTPCIVVNSKSHKVKGCYEWIKDLGYIKFADSADELESIYTSIDLSLKYSYNNEHLMKYYDELAQIIREG